MFSKTFDPPTSKIKFLGNEVQNFDYSRIIERTDDKLYKMPDSAAEDDKASSMTTSGSSFEAGSLAWARLESTPFWPALILNADNGLFQVQVRIT